MKYDLQKYEEIQCYFEKGEYNCAHIARKTGIKYKQVLKYFSAYLRSMKMKNKLCKEIIK